MNADHLHVEPAATVAAARALLKQDRLAEAHGMVAGGLVQNPVHPGLLRMAATVAEKQGDVDATLGFWARLRAAAPTRSAGYVGALRSLRKFNRKDLVPEILAAGRTHLWDDLEFVLQAARLVASNKKPDEAAIWWQRVMELAPDDPAHGVSAAQALMGARKGRRKRLRTVVERLQAHHERFPAYVPAYIAHIEALREMRKLADADRGSATWCKRFPDDVALALARVAVLEDLGRADEALANVAALRARCAPQPELDVAYIRALSGADQTVAAEEAGEAALRAWPKERAVWLEYARVASRQADWDATLSRLEQAQQALGNDGQIARELATVRAQLAAPDEAVTASTGGLFSRFESLGGSGMGCEFGMLQRRMGSDVLGLLRWSLTRPPEMITALNTEFEGVGDEANTVLDKTRVSVNREEYISKDTRYFMESHTFVRTTDAPADRMHTQTCRRLRFLRGKLLEDLRSGERIFVYKAVQPLPDETVRALHAAVARYGRNALLCVMRADDTNLPGSVRALGDGAFVGYVGYFVHDPGTHIGSDAESWTAICTEVDQAWWPQRAAA